MVYRSIKIGIQIEEGKDILDRGFFLARCLWDDIHWSCFGYIRKLQRAREGKIHIPIMKNGKEIWIPALRSLKGRLPKRASLYDMDRELRRTCWAWKELSDRCASYTLREFDAATKAWFQNLKKNTKARPPRMMGKGKLRHLRFEHGKGMKHLGDWVFRLTVLGGQIEERHTIVELKPAPGIKVNQVKNLLLFPGNTEAVLVYSIQEVEQANGCNFAAIDLGIKNLAMLFFDNGESILYSGRGILSQNQYYAKKMAKCKPRNYPHHKHQREMSETKKRYSKKSTSKRNQMLHTTSHDIIEQCVARGIGTLIIGDLKGIRKEQDWGKRKNQELHMWPFAKFSDQLAYKAEAQGIKLVRINERGTSSTCPFCESKKVTRKPRGLLTCRDCGMVINSDLAGSINLLKKYLLDSSNLGVKAFLSRLRSTALAGIPLTAPSQITPTFVAKFDLRTLELGVRRCGASIVT